jgi:hypothetical protein
MKKSTWITAKFDNGEPCDIEIKECEDLKHVGFFLGSESLALQQGNWKAWSAQPQGDLVFQNRNGRKITVSPKL